MELQKEWDTYQRELPRLLESQGKYVVIHGDEVAGTYDTFRDALNVGYQRFGLNRFVVHEIQLLERVHILARGIVPCRTCVIPFKLTVRLWNCWLDLAKSGATRLSPQDTKC